MLQPPSILIKCIDAYFISYAESNILQNVVFCHFYRHFVISHMTFCLLLGGGVHSSILSLERWEGHV